MKPLSASDEIFNVVSMQTINLVAETDVMNFTKSWFNYKTTNQQPLSGVRLNYAIENALENFIVCR